MGNILPEPRAESENKKSVIFYSDEEQYVGECIGDVREGAGVYTYANGDKYEGQWEKNMKHGKGYFYYNNGELYMGEWYERFLYELIARLKNKKCGKGMYFYQTGDRFDGLWQDNVKEGEGVYYYVDGTIYEGVFKNSKKHGNGIMKMPDGSIYEEIWDEGQTVSRKQTKKPDPDQREETKPAIQKSKSLVHKFAKKPHKPKFYQDELSVIAHLNVSQYINEKLLNKNINQWKTKDVGDWLDRGGFTKYKSNFESNHITGRNLLELTENDLNEELGIKDANHRKKIMKDIKFLAKIYSKTQDEPEYIREKLLNFYKKNQGELFPKKSSINAQDAINVTGPFAPPMIRRTSDMTIVSRQLKDVNDKQDALDASVLKSHISSSSSSSSSESEESVNTIKKDEQSEGIEKAAPGRKANNQPRKKSDETEKNHLHMSEYRTILNNYKENDYDLLQTIHKTIGVMSVIDHSELELEQSIGEGGYGEVFKGKWLGQDVAIKVYGRKKVRNKEKLDADFLREVEVISKLRHPNITLFMGVSISAQGKGLLVTEYLEEGSLFDHLHKKMTKLDDNQIISIALDIALGLNYLHGQRILHCDLKSSNILLDEHFNVKLGDFGLSKSKRKFQGKKNKRVGTPHWMAPEIMREEEYDESSDVYSYGMILWELMVRKVPYFGLKVNQIVGSVGYGEKQVPIPESGNEIINTLMKKCLSKDRTERPSFKDIAEYLKDTNRHRKLIAMRELDGFFN